MSDRKLQQVALASFNYRHEAEFAAGFLRDAGIPFRLQVEDPTLGLSAINSATIWVSAMDEREARRVLDHEITPLDDADDSWADVEAWDDEGAWDDSDDADSNAAFNTVDAAKADYDDAGRAGAPLAPPRASPMDRHKRRSDLTLRQRTLALAASVGLSSTLAIEVVREAVLAQWGVGLGAAGLVLAAVLGRAPGPIRGILEALSGDAP